MNIRRFWVTFVLAALIVVGVACAPAPILPTPTPTPIPATPTPTVVTAVDDAGGTVEIEGIPQRIISLAPSNTEILFALGLGKKMVGVTDFCDYPEEAKAVEKIGGIEPNLEKLVSLDPGLILAIGGDPELISKLEELGLTVAVLNPSDLEGIYRGIELVGKAAGVDEAAAELVAEMREQVDEVTAKTQEVAERPKVFYELDATDPTKPYSAGPGTWHDQFIRLAGGTNIAATAEMQWVQFSTEQIIAQNPDIIVLGDAAWGVMPESVAERPGWEVIAAVQNGAICPIDDNLIARPGPRVVEGIKTLAEIIHPELFE